MEIVDQSTWPRADAFKLFSAIEYPFYSVTVPMDVTGSHSCKRNDAGNDLSERMAKRDEDRFLELQWEIQR